MLRYVVRRVLWGAVLLVIVSLVVFLIFYVFPSGDPARLRAGAKATPEQVQQIRESLDLDEPAHVQYLTYMEGLVLHQDFGYSYQYNQPVLDQIKDRLPVTALLVAGAVVIWLAISIPTGIISAVKRRSLLDRATMITTLVFISAPVFWLGLVALYLLSEEVGQFALLPGQGSYLDANTFLERCSSMIMPWFVLAGATAAIYARYLRSSMIDVMAEDYIRTARAKGLEERQVLMRHGFRSAVTPIVTLLGLDIGLLLAGNAILTESVFNIPGVGRLVVTAIDRADLPVIQGVVLVGAFFIVVLNLLVDIAYAYLDPRVRYQ